ncbi:DUF2093 domain-containing protein [Sphingomonas sp. LB-2]|uniref:DUF2093 domain-containing protein n=1 Tax=Sphingomonas caeni TaxID=2984949 RepID=UPI00222E80BF|nr:DUF2093 domain-containing protein [Sphingomonas caeni]MCW3846277.1 DUF2093 domain-containing protein [Sphingomonas caeni]
MLMSNTDRPARLHYLANGFRVLTPGGHVTCAVSGEAIPLDALRYWSVARQEPYASAEIALKAMLG